MSFLYNSKQYPLNFSLFKKHSNYFSGRSENNVYYLIDNFDSYHDFTDNEINSFIDYCQDKNIDINESNYIGIDYLSKKYKVDSLNKKLAKYLKQNHQKIIQSFFTKTGKIESIIEEEEEDKDDSLTSNTFQSLNYNNNDKFVNIPKNIEDIVSFYFVEVLFDLDFVLYLIPISNLYRILTKFSKSQNNVSFKKTKDEIEYKIISFLFNYIKKWGIEASILLIIFEFGSKNIEYFNEQLNIHRNNVDYNLVIKEKLFQNMNFVQTKQDEKLKGEVDRIYREMNKLKSTQEEKLKNGIDKLNEQNKLLQKEVDIMKETINQIKKDQSIEQKILKTQIENQDLHIKYLKFIILSNFQKTKWPQISLYSFISEIAIPPTFSFIDKKSFLNCLNLQEIIIPSSIIKIGDNAFEGCSSLTKIEIPSSVSEIGSNAFSKCFKLSQMKIDLKQTKFQSNSFDECPYLNSLILTSLTGIIDNENYEHIFKQIGNITTISFSSLINTINDDAFNGCSFLKQVNFPSSLKKIGNRSFEGCSSLSKIEIPESVCEIGNYSFHKCTKLAQLTIDLYHTEIRDNSFKNCPSLNYVIFSSSTATCIEENTFSRLFKHLENINHIKIPPSILHINSYAFDNCMTLTEIQIPSSVTKIGNYAFNNCLFLKEIQIPDSVIHIGHNAFNKCSSLTQINLPNSVINIGECAFNKCSLLEQIQISESLTCISNHLFNLCASLKQIKIPESITQIDNYAFNECTSLIQIQIPNSVTKIGNYAFNECTSLIQIQIPNSVIYIGEYAFNKCSLLEQIQISESLTCISNHIFNLCASLKQIKIPESVTQIDNYAFNECTSLIQIQIPNSVTKIGNYAFNHCKSLINIEIPPNICEFGNYSFIEDPIFNDIQYPIILEIFKKSIFMRCSSLKQISFLKNEIEIDKYIDFNDYEIEDNISSSSNLTIFKVKQKSTGKEFIMKIIPSYVFNNIKEFLQIIHSIPNFEGVLQIKGYHLPLSEENYSPLFEENYNNFLNNYVVLTEYMKNGALNIFFNSTKMTPTIKCKIIFGVAATMKKLHEIGMFNIDLHNDNIFNIKIFIF